MLEKAAVLQVPLGSGQILFSLFRRIQQVTFPGPPTVRDV